MCYRHRYRRMFSNRSIKLCHSPHRHGYRCRELGWLGDRYGNCYRYRRLGSHTIPFVRIWSTPPPPAIRKTEKRNRPTKQIFVCTMGAD